MLKKYLFFIFIFSISLIPAVDLFKSGLPMTHDGPDHVIRLANFYQNLSEGNIIPRWASNVNYGYGHPFLMFFYPLPYYIGSLFHFLGFSLINSTKLVFGAAYILSSIAMYAFIKELLKNEKAAFSAALLYVIAPYRFVDLYVRGAIGEHVAFIFPPLIFYFLIKISKNYSFWYMLGGSLSVTGLILSHNATALMFLPLIFIYILYLAFQCFNKKCFVLNTLYIILFGFGLSAFFWIPAFMEGKYTLRDIVTGKEEYAASFVALKDFFVGLWDYGGSQLLSKQIGVIHWVGVFGSVIGTYYLYKKRNKLWMVCLGSFLIFLATLFLMSSSSSLIWQTITTLQKFQFPWRFLSVTVFLSALMGGISLSLISNRYKNIALLILIVSLLVVNKDYWHAEKYLLKNDDFFTVVQRTTTNDTGESSPIWSTRFMEQKPNANVEIIAGKGLIKEVQRSTAKHIYEIDVKDKVRIRENTLYFPGWTVLADGVLKEIEFQDPANRGLITFYLDKGIHKVNIEFNETRLRIFANILSGISLIGLVAFSLFATLNKRRSF